MKNKKGFTLVELLAVIAILAILMLLVTPNVLNLFKEGQKDAFVTQVQRVWKAAETQYLTDVMAGKTPGPYCSGTNAGETGENKLQVTENKKLHYYVSLDENGNVSKLLVSDGSYYYNKDVPSIDVEQKDVNNGKATITCADGTLTPAS